MSNPWQNIPLGDYEGHMGLPTIDQARMVSQEFARLLREHPAKTAALIGCSGGNGFAEAVEAGVTRLVGFDINAEYIEEARRRFAGTIPGLELFCVDIQGELPPVSEVDLVFAALVFEYVDAPHALQNIRQISRPGATLGVVLQLPNQIAATISVSPYTSLQSLGSIMRLVPPSDLRAEACASGFMFLNEWTVKLPAGKCFRHQIFKAT